MSERIESKEEMDRITTIEVRRRTSSKLQILKHFLDFKSVDEMLTVFMAVVYNEDLRKEDLLRMAIKVESGTATCEHEMHEKLGLVKKQIHVCEKGFLVKGKVEKKKKVKEDERQGINDE